MPVDSIGLLALALMYMLLFIFLLIPRDIFHPTLGLGVVCLENNKQNLERLLGFKIFLFSFSPPQDNLSPFFKPEV